MMNHPRLTNFPIIIEFDAAWGDMDSFGHINNVVFFRYFENARIDYMQKLGWFDHRKATGLGPIVASSQARFRRPIQYPDHLFSAARISAIEPDRVTFEHCLVSANWQDVAAEGQSVIVSFDYNVGKKSTIPDLIRQRIDDLQKPATLASQDNG